MHISFCLSTSSSHFFLQGLEDYHVWACACFETGSFCFQMALVGLHTEISFQDHFAPELWDIDYLNQIDSEMHLFKNECFLHSWCSETFPLRINISTLVIRSTEYSGNTLNLTSFVRAEIWCELFPFIPFPFFFLNDTPVSGPMCIFYILVSFFVSCILSTFVLLCFAARKVTLSLSKCYFITNLSPAFGPII